MNGQPIYKNQVNEVLNRYNDGNVDKDTIIENGIKELLILQQGNQMGITVDKNEIAERMVLLKSNYPEIYNIAIKQYRGIENYKKALEYRILYEKIKQKVIHDVDDNLRLINNSEEYFNQWTESLIKNAKIQYIKSNKSN